MRRHSVTPMLHVAPPCPANGIIWHLPHEGGDWQLCGQWLFCNVADLRKPSGRPISPLVGEMSGRTEGRAKDRDVSDNYADPAAAP